MNVERRRWDVQEFERKAQQEARAKAAAEAERSLPATAPLRSRDAPLPLTATLGKSILVSSSTPLSGRGGYYCDVCLCLLKDSLTFLDHVNGRKHQKKQGITMRIEKVAVSDVKDRLKQLREMKEEESDRDREQRRKRKRQQEDEQQNDQSEEEEEQKAAQGVKRREELKEAAAETTAAPRTGTEDEDEEAMMAAMGFTAFTAGKKT